MSDNRCGSGRSKFHMRQADAAESLGICVSTLQQACRQLGIMRWPWRESRKFTRTSTRESPIPSISSGVKSGSRSDQRPIQNLSANTHTIQYAGIKALHMVRSALLDSKFEDGDLVDSTDASADARPMRLKMNMIWHRCNINNRGLLDEAMDFV